MALYSSGDLVISQLKLQFVQIIVVYLLQFQFPDKACLLLSLLPLWFASVRPQWNFAAIRTDAICIKFI